MEGETLAAATPRLPKEILEIIFDLAALQDKATAVSLALVSREVCNMTAESRWTTVVLRSMAAAKRFFVTLAHYPSSPRDSDERNGKPEAEERLPTEVREMLNYLGPKRLLSKPDFVLKTVDNLFIEMRDFDSHEWRHFLDAWALYISAHEDSMDTDTLSKGPDGGPLRVHFDLRTLTLGAAESAYHCSLDSFPLLLMPCEVTIVIDAAAEYTSLSYDSDSDSGDEEERVDTKTTYEQVLRQWVCRRELKRVHIIGTDSASKEAGLAFPADIVEARRAGSNASLGWEHQWEPHPDVHGMYRRVGVPIVSHIRYDTRRFAFQPTEIVARRLAPFLREIVFADRIRCGSDAIAADGKEESHTSSTSTSTYSGPRHAAPTWGAGRHGSTGNNGSNVAISVHDEDSEEAQALRDLGVGGLKRLEFAWDLPPKILQEQLLRRERENGAESHGSSSTHRKEDEQGGWPREAHDVWTHRMDGGKTMTFRSEMHDAVTELYGWAPADAPPRPSREEKKRWLGQYRFVDEESGSMVKEVASVAKEPHKHFLEHIEREVPVEVERRRKTAQGSRQREREYNGKQGRPERGPLSPPPLPPVAHRKLKYAVRAPSTLLKLGDATAALDVDTRLALFLDRALGGPGAWK